MYDIFSSFYYLYPYIKYYLLRTIIVVSLFFTILHALVLFSAKFRKIDYPFFFTLLFCYIEKKFFVSYFFVYRFNFTPPLSAYLSLSLLWTTHIFDQSQTTFSSCCYYKEKNRNSYSFNNNDSHKKYNMYYNQCNVIIFKDVR